MADLLGIMSMYARYKKDPEGFRRLVELLETTPLKRREELIAAGMKEDASYTKAAVEHIMTFQDLLQLPEMEMTEVIASMKPKNVAFCVHTAEAKDKERFLACVQKNKVLEVHSYLDMNPGSTEVGQARKEAITCARTLEQKGLLSIKKIPKNFTGKEKQRAAKKPIKKGENTLIGAKDELFSEGLFGENSDFGEGMIGKKKAS